MGRPRRWTTILLLRDASDRYAGARRIGPLCVRDLDRPPPGGVAEDGEIIPPGWQPGMASRYRGGVAHALAEELRGRRGLRVYVVTVASAKVSDYRAALPGLLARVREASAGWSMPRTIVLARSFAPSLDADLRERWPGREIVWAPPAGTERPAARMEAE